ncbi:MULTISPECIES: stage II sporulation protein P [unclassified Candidatus Frackibacter]|uniref:stage II sporulation protein P n=1 Tax=unclassified Candidatus Frackibacter TaxID=2648818 RepID=UPI000887C2E7|nr:MULTISPECIES: stage II sporulation protein P [unclassified Candidatus Frackibacter]SDC52311.1 stage II sporulation protein P [Candidatus Frackibacter sp. WG11]SEM41482.1 stage II sporulation protein P [Candidatus Frackibacter sp. WG12]SFL76177.1 stage II sporulation protein P [Candidatus Frackibacter sp. WG13]
MNKKVTKTLILSLVFLMIFSTLAYAEQEKKDGYFTVVDENGKVIFQTAMMVHKGDWYINQNNKKYVVTKVNGDQAIVKYEGTVDLTTSDDLSSSISQPEALLSKEEAKKEITIYNTHSDESYVPTSGTHTEPGNGDVYNVADVFAKQLSKKGIKVIASNAKHDPHDGGAYERSRRTAKKLAQKRPDAIFDIHRDGVPDPSQYVTTIDGKKVSQVRLVVGRQNPNMKVNDKFAKQLKATADKVHPGLIKGIFYAKGKYNQDLSPRAMLLEMGTHVIPREQAKRGAVMFADAVNQLLYGGGKQQAQGAGQVNAEQDLGAFTSLLIILAVVTAGIFGYLFINEGSWEGVMNRIRRFFGQEMVNFLGFEDGIKRSNEDKDGDKNKDE